MTGRECGDERGLAGLPRAAAEISEGYFSGWGRRVVAFPLRNVGSKPKAGLSSLQHESREGTQITQGYEKQRGSVCQERQLEMQRASDRANAQYFVCSHLPGVPAEGGLSGLEMLEESLGLVALGRELEEQSPGSLC